MLMLEWIKDRAIEPSTCVAVGVILVGAGVLIDMTFISIIGIVVSAGGFFLKEKGPS
jgi:hypothetical protein|tara:strand:- start:567 stop:737 length:171 start_codon:yes stop_codon:yes gene_type:complete